MQAEWCKIKLKGREKKRQITQDRKERAQSCLQHKENSAWAEDGEKNVLATSSPTIGIFTLNPFFWHTLWWISFHVCVLFGPTEAFFFEEAALPWFTYFLSKTYSDTHKKHTYTSTHTQLTSKKMGSSAAQEPTINILNHQGKWSAMMNKTKD